MGDRNTKKEGDGTSVTYVEDSQVLPISPANSSPKSSQDGRRGSATLRETRLLPSHGEDYPTQEEMKTLRRVRGRIPLKAFTIAFIELCERFSYYGTTVLV